MNATLGEHICAFLDGQLPEHEVELLLKRLEREPQLRATLSRYSTIGECLRNEYGALSPDFADNISCAIAGEAGRGGAGQIAVSQTTRREWLRQAGQWAGGLALAATVAGIAIFVLQRESAAPLTAQSGTQTTLEDRQDLQLVAEAPRSAPEAETVVLGNTRGGESYSYTVPAPVSVNPVLPEARLTDYVFAHSEYSSPLGRRNVLSSVIAEDPTPVNTVRASAHVQNNANNTTNTGGGGGADRGEDRSEDNNHLIGSPLFYLRGGSL